MGGDPAPQRTRYPLFGANRRRSPTPICPLSRSIPSAETKPDICSVATQARFTVQRLSRGNLLKHGRGSEARGCDTHSSGLFRRYATPALWDGARRRPFYDRVGASHAGALASRESPGTHSSRLGTGSSGSPDLAGGSGTYRATRDWSQRVVSTRILHRLQRPVAHQSRLQWIYPRTRFKLHSTGPPTDASARRGVPALYDARPEPICVLVTRARAYVAAFRHGF
jgi:hypothetical protein